MPGVLRAEKQREPSGGHVEIFRRTVVGMRRGGYDTVAFCPQRGDQIAGASRFVDIDPLVGSPDDVDVRRELAQRFDRVDILYAERFAVAHQRAGVLRMERILHAYGHVAGPAGERGAQHFGPFRQHETGNVFDLAGQQSVVIFGIFGHRPTV